MKLVLKILIVLMLVSCEKESDPLKFTDKWWQSTSDNDFFIRFNSNKTYEKEFLFSPFVPAFVSYIPSQTMKISGKWSIEKDIIKFETNELIKDDPIIFLDNDQNVIHGLPYGFVYGIQPGDSINYTDSVLTRWNINGTVSDSFYFQRPIIVNDFDIDSRAPVIWIMKEVGVDTFELIVNSRIEKFVFARNKE